MLDTEDGIRGKGLVGVGFMRIFGSKRQWDRNASKVDGSKLPKGDSRYMSECGETVIAHEAEQTIPRHLEQNPVV